jgi:hypothetical protein
VAEGVQCEYIGIPECAVIDATFFGRSYGFLCVKSGHRMLYFREIRTESIAVLEECLNALEKAGFRLASCTIDGKRGFVNLLKKRYPALPVQMCHFHQQAIVRRYITSNPKTQCGIELQQLMRGLSHDEPQDFIDALFALKARHKDFLLERNEAGELVHKRLRSAVRSLVVNLPYLFVYKEIRGINIPHTTNSLEGTFSHLKEKIKIHRGLCQRRKKNAAKFILKNSK